MQLSGQITVTTAGTAVAGPSTTGARQVAIKAHPGNTAGASAQILAVKVVGGTSTGFGQTNITFVANALLEIRRTAATTFQFWYNGTQFFGDQTISDAAILAGGYCGMAMLCDGWRVSEFQMDGVVIPFRF